MNPFRQQDLTEYLERIYASYHHPRFLYADPLALVHEFSTPEDQEVAALFAALLAYGQVGQILKDLRDLYERMDWQPAAFVRDFQPRDAIRRLEDFKHRFTEGEDLAAMCALLHRFTRKASLEARFRECVDERDVDLAPALDRFVGRLLDEPLPRGYNKERILAKHSFKHLVPRPAAGSACKRWFLFLRWVVRPRDGIDLGLWPSVSPSKLLMPLDSHIRRITANLGLLEGSSASLKAARKVTEAFRQISPHDPTRYDFALCHLGILQECPTHPSLRACAACELKPVCKLCWALTQQPKSPKRAY
jgi:uncharacterized protein (TIGR02757 family)